MIVKYHVNCNYRYLTVIYRGFNNLYHNFDIYFIVQIILAEYYWQSAAVQSLFSKIN